MFSRAVRGGTHHTDRTALVPDRAPCPTPQADFIDLAILVQAEVDPLVLLTPREDGGRTGFVIGQANEAGLALLNLRREDLGYATLGAVLPRLLSTRVPAICERVWRDGEPVNQQDLLWSSMRQGPGWVDVRVRRYGGHLALLLLDVTARHRQQEEYAAGEARFRALAERASDLVFQTRGADRLAWVSPGLGAVLGYHPADVVGRELAHLLHPEDVPGPPPDPDFTDEPQRFDARFRHAQGHWVWMSVVTRSEYDDDGQLIGRVGSARDISGHKDLDEALQARERRERAERDRLRAVLNAALDPQIVLRAVLDDAGRLTALEFEDCNTAAARYLGRTRDELVDQPIHDVVGDRVACNALAWARRVLATGTPLVLRDRPMLCAISHEHRRFDLSMVRLDGAVSVTWRDVGR